MGIIAIFFLILGISFIISSILVYNHFRHHPKKVGFVISVLYLFVLGIISIIGAITGHIGLVILLSFVILIVINIYYVTIKYPEIKKNREKNMEIAKKRPLYKFLRIASYIMFAFAIFLIIFTLIIVLHNIIF
jgi:Ca2+/Na+ antiporter